MKKIKIFSLVMSIALLFSATVSAATFSDIPASIAQADAQAIEKAVANGLLSGYEDGTFRPYNNIKRSEMAVIITKACKVVKEANISSYNDVAETDWFYSAMAKAVEMGAFVGDGFNLNPNNNITFQECFTVLSQVFDLLPSYTIPAKMPEQITADQHVLGRRLYDISVLNNFADKNEVATWARPYVAGVVINNGWSGVDGKLTPTAYITRLQFAVVMNNLIQNYIDAPGTYDSLPAGNTMIRCDGVILNNVNTDYDLYIGDSVSAKGVTVNNMTSSKRVVVRGCATPVIKEPEGYVTYGDTGITLSGNFNFIRVIRPFIKIDVTQTKYNSIYVSAASIPVVPVVIKNN